MLLLCLVFAVDDSDSYLSEEENEEEPSLPGVLLLPPLQLHLSQPFWELTSVAVCV